jgi:hypothetical protein
VLREKLLQIAARRGWLHAPSLIPSAILQRCRSDLLLRATAFEALSREKLGGDPRDVRSW